MPNLLLADLEELEKVLAPMIESAVCNLLKKLNHQQTNQDPEWLPLVEAKKVLPIQSKKKWKQLRDQADIDFAKAGKGFVYNRVSLIRYLEKNSTIRSKK